MNPHQIAAEAVQGWAIQLRQWLGYDVPKRWIESLIAEVQASIEKVRTETLAECRAATEQQICDLQDRIEKAYEQGRDDARWINVQLAESRAAHASDGGEEPLNIVIHVLREVVKRCGGNSHLGSLAKNALAELEQSPPPTVKQWREAHAREPFRFDIRWTPHGNEIVGNPNGKYIEAQPAHASEPWHPASEPPKPEDFEPTGQVLCVTIFNSGKIHPWFGTPKNQLADADYWLTIKPPVVRAAHASEPIQPFDEFRAAKHHPSCKLSDQDLMWVCAQCGTREDATLQQSADTKRLDWIEADEKNIFTAQQIFFENYRNKPIGMRQAIDAAMSQTKEKE